MWHTRQSAVWCCEGFGRPIQDVPAAGKKRGETSTRVQRSQVRVPGTRVSVPSTGKSSVSHQKTGRIAVPRTGI